jgi:hypothetical protein
LVNERYVFARRYLARRLRAQNPAPTSTLGKTTGAERAPSLTVAIFLTAFSEALTARRHLRLPTL